MSNQSTFAHLIARVRAGDEQAVGELIACYEPHIRRVVQMRIGARLRRVVDTSDVLQSVHLDLARALRGGQFEILTAQQLVQLTTAIAKHKLLAQAAHWGRERRRLDRELPLGPSGEEALPQSVAREPTPSQHVAAEELNQILDEKATPIERTVIGLRRQGLDNKEIASRLGKTPAAVRMILNRARHRLAAELGFESKIENRLAGPDS
jgi:RNA polymerase sigma-70 factor (ECF subfamily)